MKHITMEDWKKAGDFDSIAEVGDVVAESIIGYFVTVLPPVSDKYDSVQVGEPYSHEYDTITETWRPTYTTFCKENGTWVYCGHCFTGEREEPGRGKGE